MARGALETSALVRLRPDTATVLERLRAGLPDIQSRAVDLDRDGGFPTEDLAFLRTCGALDLFGRDDIAPRDLMEALRLVGRGSLSLGRVFEGHANGARLVAWYGDPAQRARLDGQLRAGEVFGVWNTERPPGLRADEDGGRLIGAKCFATGAGHIDHAIVTARLATGERQMVLARANEPARADASGWRVAGMKATLSGTYDLTGLPIDERTRLGAPGDYEVEPRFSAGAWRFTAVQLGGVERILILLRQHLAASPAGGDPVHRARFALAVAQTRSALLWVREAATRAEAGDAGAAEVGFVRMTRGVVERAGLAVIEAARRSVGTRAFFDDNPLDHACRDLELYLRQPAPDEALDRAAAAFLAEDCWRDDPLW